MTPPDWMTPATIAAIGRRIAPTDRRRAHAARAGCTTFWHGRVDAEGQPRWTDLGRDVNVRALLGMTECERGERRCMTVAPGHCRLDTARD
jgi:hypothetical protein